MDQILREKLQAVSSYESTTLLLTRENGLFVRIERENAAILDGLRVAVLNPIDDASPIVIDLKLKEGLPVAMRLA